MSPDSLVSVILTVRGFDHFLDGAIRTVCSQSFRPVEIVLVDDGIKWAETSSTRLAETCEASGVGMQLVDSARGGRGHALNAGLRASRGRLVAILDADDRWHPRKLEIQVNAAKPYVVVGSRTVTVFGEDDSREAAFSTSEVHGDNVHDVTDEVLLHCPLIHSSMLMHKPLMEAVHGYDAERKSQFDWDIMARAVVSGARLLRIEAPLTLKRMHSHQSFEARNKMIYAWRSMRLQSGIQRELKAPLRYRYFMFRRVLIWLLPARLKWRLKRLFGRDD